MNKLSIIIPAHNLEGYIGDCLRSIAAQDYDMNKVQVICVLDSCTDGTEREIERTAQETGIHVFMVNVENGNCGLSRNYGLAYAEGDWVWFIDGDDLIVRPDALAKIEAAATGDIVRPTKYLHGKTVEEAKIIKTTLDAYSFIVRKDFIADERFRKEDGIFESLRFFDKLLKRSPQIVQIEEPIYFYRTPREGSVLYNHRKATAALRAGTPQ